MAREFESQTVADPGSNIEQATRLVASLDSTTIFDHLLQTPSVIITEAFLILVSQYDRLATLSGSTDGNTASLRHKLDILRQFMSDTEIVDAFIRYELYQD
ncbi:MAG: hypothetical protein WBB94_04325 [Candidatus Saccharimonadaceae bacterium]